MADYCGSLDKVKTVSVDELAAIHGVGEVVAESLVSWMHDEKNLELLSELLPHLTIKNPVKQKSANTALAGKTVVFTGALSTLSRDEAKAIARVAGAHIASSVSKKTDFVVMGDEAGSKARSARELGVTVLGEGEFLKMVR